MIYRDATYSETTQEGLRDLLAWLTTQPLWLRDHARHAEALSDVIELWDANGATEIVSD